jgi:plasmid maintenance system antidote protein VapI
MHASVTTPGVDPGQVLAKATSRAATQLGLTGAALARVIGVSEAHVSRVVSGQRSLPPQSKEGQLAALLVRVYRSLDALVGNDPERRLAWLGSFNRAVNGIPRDLLVRPEGLAAVLTYLDSMRAPI